MVDTVLLHAKADADFAATLARALKGMNAIPCPAPEDEAQPLQFGNQMQVFGVWTARSEDSVGVRLQDALDAQPRRAALLVWDNRRPPVGTSEGRTPVIAMSDDLESAAGQIAEIARSLKLGIFVSSSTAPPPPRVAPPPPAPAPARTAAAPPSRPAASPPPRARPSEAEMKVRRAAGRWGFLIGAIIGAAIVVAGLAPWASMLIQRERAEDLSQSQAIPPNG
ncbi:MAG: hypothetical protein GC189_06715 [Alphaproteobacteria bacterium]|nr:hypothetical protein [Alphaproteobacteria bacterium]